MWRTAASLELLPQQTKAQLGEALLASIKQGEMIEAAIWCLSRLGARKLFSGPINLVLPPAVAARWVEALLRLPHTPSLLEAVVQIAISPAIARATCHPLPLKASAAPVKPAPAPPDSFANSPASADDLATGSRVFGEDLPAGFVLAVHA